MLIDAWFPFYGGGQVHVKNLSQQLSYRYNTKIKIFHPKSFSDLARTFWALKVIKEIVTYSQANKIDLIHSHGFIPGLSAKIASLILGVPIIHTVHGSHLMDQGKSVPKAYLEKFLLTQIKYSSLITVSSSFLKYQNTNRNIHVIRNGVNVKDFDQITINKASNPTIIFVGRRHPDKGIDTLLKAFKLAKQKLPHLKLDIVDGGTSGKKLIKRYKRSHLFVLPSRAEGQPISLLEAWAAKLPVIVTKVGDNPKLVKNSFNGYLIRPNDFQSLSSIIIKVFNDYPHHQKMGLKGYQLVKQKYTWDKISDQTYQVYQSLLKSS